MLSIQGGVGVPERVHDVGDQHRPIPGGHLSAAATPHHDQGGRRHRRHVGAGRRRVAARRHQRPHQGHRPARRSARVLRRDMAGRTRPALRLLDGRHGATVLPAAGHPVVHLRQHRSRHLGQADAWRGGEHERSKIRCIKAQGILCSILRISVCLLH